MMFATLPIPCMINALLGRPVVRILTALVNVGLNVWGLHDLWVALAHGALGSMLIAVAWLVPWNRLVPWTRLAAVADRFARHRGWPVTPCGAAL